MVLFFCQKRKIIYSQTLYEYASSKNKYKMNIQKRNQNINQNTNFKSIKLNKQETFKAKNILNELSHSDMRAQEGLRADLFDIFSDKITKEGKLIAKSTHSVGDCTQDLFVNFFESITDSLKEKDPLKFILNKLNNFKKGKNSLKTEFGRPSLARTISTDKTTTYADIITEDINSKIDTKSQEKAKMVLDIVTDNNSLTEREQIVLEKLKEGKSKIKISEELNIAVENVHKHVSTFIKKIQYENGCLPEEIKGKIDTLKTHFKFEDKNKDIEKLLIKLPQAKSISTDKIIKVTNIYSKLLGMPAEKIVHIFSNCPTLISVDINTIKGNIKSSSKLLNITESDFVKLCKNQPSLLYMSPINLSKKAENFKKRYKFSHNDFLKLVTSSPNILYAKASTIENNIQGLAKILSISEKDCLKIIQKQPRLLARDSKQLEATMKKTAKLLNIDYKKFVSLAIRQVNLIYQKPETVFNNVNEGAKKFKLDFETLKNSYVKKPQLLIQKPDTIYKNVKELSSLLNISEEATIKLCLKAPQYFYTNPKTLYAKATELAKLKGVDLKSVIALCIKQPNILLYKTSLIKQKMNIVDLYSKVINENFSGDTIPMYKNEILYSNILRYLLRSENKSTVSSSKNVYEAVKEKISLNPNKEYTFKLPEHTETENFIHFSENLSNELLGKNIFKFRVGDK